MSETELSLRRKVVYGLAIGSSGVLLIAQLVALAAEALPEDLAKLIVVPVDIAGIGLNVWSMSRLRRWVRGK
jgi:hypothetical protein